MAGARQNGQSLIAREDCILVIIDVQERLMPAVSQKERVLENVLRLARFSGQIGLPVVVTEQEKLGPTVPELAQLLTDFHPINKTCFNCFFCHDFADRVEGLGKNTLVLTGVEAHICVAQTALFAMPRFTVHVISDAVSSRTQENRQVALERMRQSGAVISSTEMFIYELLQRAGTDEFKAALQLVK